jgi:predicted amidohydrolase
LRKVITDLMLRGGRIIDPASGCDETADIAFGDGVMVGGRRWHPPSI